MAKQTMGFSCQSLNARADQKLYHLQVSAIYFLFSELLVEVLPDAFLLFSTLERTTSVYSVIFVDAGNIMLNFDY